MGIHLQQPVFTHSQLNVSFSKTRAQQNVMVRVLTLTEIKSKVQDMVLHTLVILCITKYCDTN